ncbi:MAG: hypothetical protein IPL55_13905 [Saprospiraceae bacterium]|nr:hypothetical protein [Saprospiraceae bacterium]
METHQSTCRLPLSCCHRQNKKIKQADGHAAMIGYAMDGYGMFELLDGQEKNQLI